MSSKNPNLQHHYPAGDTIMINDGEWHNYEGNDYIKAFLEVELTCGTRIKGWPNAGKITDDIDKSTHRVGYFDKPSNITKYRVMLTSELP